MLNALGACSSMSFFISIYLNNLIPSRFPNTSETSLQNDRYLLPLPIADQVSCQRHPLSVRPFPFTFPNVRLPISSPQPCTSDGNVEHTVNSPNEITCQCPSSMPCYQSRHVSLSCEAVPTQMAAFLCGQSLF